MAYVHTLGIAVPPGQALDFGCGVGRLTQALTAHFTHATGVDIAPSMLEQARRYNRWGDRCTFILNEAPDLRGIADNSFAFVYSNYTLQHMAPAFAARYIHEFVRVAQPGGVIVFQVPCARRGRERIRAAVPPRLLRLYQRVRRRALAGPVMETHVVPQRTVERLLMESGARLVHIRYNPEHDARWMSLLYYAVKAA